MAHIEPLRDVATVLNTHSDAMIICGRPLTSRLGTRHSALIVVTALAQGYEMVTEPSFRKQGPFLGSKLF